MKILVTGHKGFIGQHMFLALKARGHDVVGCEWGDVVPSLKGFDWVVHIGAISSTQERNVDKVMLQNYDFSVELYEQCRDNNVKFQFSSSASVYGLLNEFKETSPVDPRTPYAWSKYMLERYMQNHPIEVAQAFRYFNVYGPRGEEHKGDQASPFYQFAKQARDNGTIRIFNGSEHYLRDFINVDDVVDCQMEFLNHNVSGVFNVGTGTAQSFLDVARIVARRHLADIQYIPMPDQFRTSYQQYTCADMTKTKNILKNVDENAKTQDNPT